MTSTCRFVPYETRDAQQSPSTSRAGPSRARNTPSESTLQARLRHLERLVSVLKAQKRLEDQETGEPIPGSGDIDLGDSENLICPNIKETAGPLFENCRYV